MRWDAFAARELNDRLMKIAGTGGKPCVSCDHGRRCVKLRRVSARRRCQKARVTAESAEYPLKNPRAGTCRVNLRLPLVTTLGCCCVFAREDYGCEMMNNDGTLAAPRSSQHNGSKSHLALGPCFSSPTKIFVVLAVSKV